MTFFNKKEDVLKIELTPYGRSLLSNGKLMPKYYAFFDDDIIYDLQYGGDTEDQDVTKERILGSTPSLRPQKNLLFRNLHLPPSDLVKSPSRLISEFPLTSFPNPPEPPDVPLRNAPI